MYKPTSLELFYAQVDHAIGENLQGAGFGQFRLAFQPNCGDARQIRLENTRHKGFELSAKEVQRLFQQRLSKAPINPSFQPIWQPLYQRMELILIGEGHGSLTVSFKRTGRDRWAVVKIEGGPSQLVHLPVKSSWLEGLPKG